MSFKKNKYIVVKKVLSKEFCRYLYNYSIIKRDFFREISRKKNIYKTNIHLGKFGDVQIPGSNTYSCYGDIAMETLLLKMQNVIEKKTKLKLVPTYSYNRLYVKGDELKKHVDRDSCEISATIFYGGEKWPIYIGNKKIESDYGDMILYRGTEVSHFRKPLKVGQSSHVFLHYNDVNGPFKETNKFDGRFFIGAPKLVDTEFSLEVNS